VCLEGFSLDQVVGGVVVEHNSTTSWADVLRQLGATAFTAWPARDPRSLGGRVPAAAGASPSTAANKAAVAWLLRSLSRDEEVAPAGSAGSGAPWEEFAAIRAAFPDLAYTPVYQLAEGDQVAMRATLRGTHTGALFGFAPTGKAIVWDVFCLARVAGGRVIEVCGSADWGAALGQLGLLPA
jgi:predicted ester cyclase